MPKHYWTKAEIDLLEQLYERERKSWDEIAATLKRTPWACRAKTHEIRAGRQKNDFRHQAGITENRPTVPAHVIADRDARYEAANRRTQTQEFFGDPAPGFSHLDRKRAAQENCA